MQHYLEHLKEGTAAIKEEIEMHKNLYFSYAVTS
jgi:hypothetical protein